ncbi:MAG: hypothetical protein LUG89_04290 [Methanosphaera sp.]|nr:hypothetical protein [Methanosphaera sp.]
MNNLNKVLSAVILYCIISYTFKLPNLELGLLFSILSSQISMILPGNYKTSLIVYLPLIAFIPVYPTVMVASIVGYTASLLIDILSKKGCKLLYPYSSMVFTGPDNYIDNDTRSESSTTVFLVILSIIALIFSFYGTEIMDNLSQEDLSTYLDGDDYNTGSNTGHV